MKIKFTTADNLRVTKFPWILQFAETWSSPNCIAQVRTKKAALKRAKAIAIKTRRRVDVSHIWGKDLSIYLQFAVDPEGTVSYV